MAKVGTKKQSKMKAVIKCVSMSSETSNATSQHTSSTSSPQCIRLKYTSNSRAKQPVIRVRSLQELGQETDHMRGLFEEIKETSEENIEFEEPTVRIRTRQEVRQAKNQMRKILEEMENETRCLDFEELMIVEDNPETLQPIPCEWFSARRFYKTYSRSKQPAISVRKEITYQKTCMEELLEEKEEATIENLDFLTSDPLLCMKEEVINERIEEMKQIYDSLEKDSSFPTVINNEAVVEIMKSEEIRGTLEEIRDVQEPSNEYDHSYAERTATTQKLNNAEGVYHSRTKDRDQNTRRTDENGSLSYSVEEVVNEYDDKITVEYENLDDSFIQTLGEKVEILDEKEEIENIEKKQEVPDSSEPEASNSSKKCYRCTVCQKFLDLKQSLKIHLVIQNYKKYVYCGDCFQQLASKRNLVTDTPVQKLLPRKHFLRRVLGTNTRSFTNSDKHGMAKGWLQSYFCFTLMRDFLLIINVLIPFS